MVTVVLTLHSINRWLVLFVGLAALVGVAILMRRQEVRPNFLPLRLWVILFDLQLALGLVLILLRRMGWVTTPLRVNLGQHVLLMVLALGLVHWGHIRWKRSTDEVCWCALWPLALGWLLSVVAAPWG